MNGASMWQSYLNIIPIDGRSSRENFRLRYVPRKRIRIKKESMISLFKKSELGGCMFLYRVNLTFKFYDIQKTALVIIDFYNLSEYQH